MKVTELKLPGLLHIEPRSFGDDRGVFMETWNQQRYQDCGMRQAFVQDNMSWSSKDVLRGLHFQHPHSQGKLVYVLVGEVYDVAVDIRLGSPSFGKWEGVILSDKTRNQLFIPPGFAHGFLVMNEKALFCYKCTDFYNPSTDRGVVWNDKTLGIKWPTVKPLVSPKDQLLPPLADIQKQHFLAFQG